MLIIMWIKCVCRGGYLHLFEAMKKKKGVKRLASALIHPFIIH